MASHGKGLKRRAFSLGAANAINCALQLLLPVVLVRYLDREVFGEYRLLWLAVGTIMAVAPLDVPDSLYYFLPRSEQMLKRLYVNQTLLFLAAAGLVSGWAVSPWNPWLPAQMRELTTHGAIVPAFVLLWVVAVLLDLLPTIEERIAWQAKTMIGLAALRALALSIAAMSTRQLGPVLLVMLGFVVFKVAVLLGYVAVHHGLRAPLLRWCAFVDQLRYAVPFGFATALYGLRAQADLWVVAGLFPRPMFASFSIAVVLVPLVSVFRQSVNQAFLPRMSKLQATGNVAGMLELNNQANVIVGTIVYPLLAWVFAFAEEIVAVVYTETYVSAAPVMRVYLLGLAPLVVEVASIMMLLRQGTFTAWLNLGTLIVSVALAWFGAHYFGLAGAALGTVIVSYGDLIVTLRRIGRCLAIPFRRLQDWRTLSLLLLFALLAAAIARGVVDHYFAASGPFVRLAFGAGLVAVAYGATWVRLAVSRGWGLPRSDEPSLGSDPRIARPH